jgi:Domain of unknown function (DUF4401)
MSISGPELLDQLQLPVPDADATDVSRQVDRPWYISFLLGASGWLAGVFMLIFVALLFKPDSQGALVVCGVILIAAAWGLYKADREGAFVTQLALAFSIAGQVLLVAGFAKGSHGIAEPALVAFFVQTVLVFIMPNALHRMLSALFACVALAMAVRYGLFAEAYSFRSTTDAAPTLSHALAGWGLTWLPIAALIFYLIRDEAQWMARGWQAIARPALSGLIVGLAFGTLISHPFEMFDWSLRNDVNRGHLALWPLLSGIAAIAAIAAGFALKSRALMGISLIGAILHISHFYYALGTTLLLKSLIMAVMGLVMLGTAYWLKRGGESA